MMAANSRFFHPYYCLNVALMGTYLTARAFVDMSALEQTDISSFGLSREQQIFGVAIVFYLVKLPHMTTTEARIANLFLYFKFVVTAIAVMVDIRMFIGYLLIFLVFAIFVKQPEYKGDHKTVTFMETKDFYDRVCDARNNGNGKTWLIYCYASWADNCLHLSPVFAHLSLKYAGKYLKFGKIDVGKHAGIANKYKISIRPSTKQLPTLLLIQNGKEIARMPDFVDYKYKNKVKKVPLSFKNIEETLKLAEMTKKPKAVKNKKKKQQKAAEFNISK